MIFLLMELDSKFESMLFDQKIIGEPISTSVMVLPPLELPSIVSTSFRRRRAVTRHERLIIDLALNLIGLLSSPTTHQRLYGVITWLHGTLLFQDSLDDNFADLQT
jgi:hypothetical protein